MLNSMTMTGSRSNAAKEPEPPALADSSSTQGESSGLTGKKRVVNRRKRIQPTGGTYWPGLNKRAAERRILKFLVPTSTRLGTDDEFAAVRTLAAELQELVEHSAIHAVGVEDDVFSVGLLVRPNPDGNDAELLSGIFRDLQPFIEDSDLLQAGLSGKLPSWKFLIRDFVAADGGFVIEDSAG
ncbi:hypothetical protein [Caenimonas sp. SL110]|uniref:hypothetical protein n=1 Tax=Caenimonas sp. SL110 TaxID=1450524 RepID=UPI00128B8263|nr:hypothetical protein [Caenimonas sp. SL110]